MMDTLELANETCLESSAPPQAASSIRPFRAAFWLIGRCARGIGSAAHWLFGVVSLVVGLALLAALPVVQLLSLGYFFESSARVARGGRLRDGLIGVRAAAHVGGLLLGAALSLLPMWLLLSYTESAALIDPGGPAYRSCRVWLAIVGALTLLHLASACARGGRLRSFCWPVGSAVWWVRRLRRPGAYSETRDAMWMFFASFRVPHYFRLGLLGYIGTLIWLLPPCFLISLGGRVAPLGFVGALWLALIVPFLPFLQVHFGVERKLSAMFDRKAVKERFLRAPWAFAFALFVLLLAAIPLYLLKIEMIPREAAWLPCLVFVAFLAPARLLTGWAYARSARRARPRHWLFRAIGRLAIVPVALLYVLVVFLAQYTSWGGAASLFEQHAFLLPVPFVKM